MLGPIDLEDWADEDDLVRAEIRLLPVVHRVASDPGLMRILLGNEISGRLRAFIKGRELSVEALHRLLAGFILAGRPPSP